jgi:hypothetical protein
MSLSFSPRTDMMKKFLLLLLFTLAASMASTSAGAAQGGPVFLFSIPEGQPALPFPRGVAVDANGNMVVSLWDVGQVVKLDPNGSLLTTIGTLGAGDGQFNYPSGVAVDGGGNIYVADTYNHRVQVFNAAGGFLRKFGTCGAGDGQFYYPSGVAVDGGGNIYVADTYNHRVQVFGTDSDGDGIADAEDTCPNESEDMDGFQDEDGCPESDVVKVTNTAGSWSLRQTPGTTNTDGSPKEDRLISIFAVFSVGN